MFQTSISLSRSEAHVCSEQLLTEVIMSGGEVMRHFDEEAESSICQCSCHASMSVCLLHVLGTIPI